MRNTDIKEVTVMNETLARNKRRKYLPGFFKCYQQEL